MTDQCNHCSYKGDLAACKAAECSKHKDWYAMQLQKELDELKASIPKIKADLINSVLDNCAWYHNREFIKIDELIEYANQLEGKE